MNSLAIEPQKESESFRKALVASVVGHVALVLFFTVRAVFFSGEAIQYEAAVKVDLVALPDKLEQPAPPPVAPPAPETVKKAEPPAPAKSKEMAKKEPKKDLDAVNLKKTEKKQQAAIEKLKQMEAMEEIEKQLQEENRKKALEKLKQIKGNAISSGTELKGVAKLQHDNYIATVERHIRQNWSVPEWLAKKKLSAQVRVRFDQNGNVISREIAKSSGNSSFDDIVIQTVQVSSPVPAPPEKFAKILNSEGILLGFPE